MSKQYQSSFFVQFGVKQLNFQAVGDYTCMIKFDFDDDADFLRKFNEALSEVESKFCQRLDAQVKNCDEITSKIENGKLFISSGDKTLLATILQLVKIHDHLACEPFRG